MPSTTTLCQAQVSYKKLSGLLELNATHLQWTPTGKHTPTVRVPHSQAISLFCSKEGSSQVKLKLGLIGDDAGHTFLFTAPPAVAAAEREKFKRELTNIIGNNRNGSIAPTPEATPSVTSKATLSAPPTNRAAQSVSRATSVSSNGRSSSVAAAEDFRMRKKVLMKNSELADLHRDLVVSGQITEQEFWDGREHLLYAEAAEENQTRGRPGQLVDPRPQTVAGGDIKIVITPQLVHDIFEEYPVVAKAYNETVPNQLSEAEFWKRYFQSRLFNSHRASIRATATQHVVKEDPIFDKYVEKDDDELEPRTQREKDIDMLIDLYATQEDHGETGNQKDVSMQAGRQRGALPLIRRFNEHSERLLNSAMGELPNKRRRLDPGDSSSSQYSSQIDLDDLHDPESSAGITLEMQDRSRYFEGRTGIAKSEKLEAAKVDMKSALLDLQNQTSAWEPGLKSLKLDKKATEAVFTSMTHNVQTRLQVKMRKNDIPEDILRQMTTCQTAANEFLRQFWSSIYIPTSEGRTLAPSAPAQRQAKAKKMVGYLAKTPEKIDAIIRTARNRNIDVQKVEVAMKPVLNAVTMALQLYQTRNSTKTSR